jgi:hypothetical protein
MFVGNEPLSGYVNDTWEYDGVNWTQVTTASGPSARGYHAMAYDSVRGKVVMFGGYSSASGNVNDTWEYDGVNWTQVTTASSPSGRYLHAMVYDGARGRVVMFGGYASGFGLFNETWEYDGVDWTQVTTAGSPSARYLHAMVYDSTRGQVVLFGGNNGASGSIVNDTWEYDANTPAHATTYGTGCGTPALGFSPTSDPIIGTSAGALISNAPTIFAGVTLGTSDTIFNGLPILPYNLASLGMPGCYLLQSNEIFGLPVTPVAASTLQFDAPIPFNATLLGQHFYIQAYAFAPEVNAAQVVTSNGIAWTIGNQ